MIKPPMPPHNREDQTRDAGRWCLVAHPVIGDDRRPYIVKCYQGAGYAVRACKRRRVEFDPEARLYVWDEGAFDYIY